MSRTKRRLVALHALPTAARALLILVGLSPFIGELGTNVPGLGWLAEWLDRWFAFQCSQDPARSFHFLGRLLPVCARCLGIYMGLGLGAAVLRPHLRAGPLRIWVGLAALVMLLDVVTETLGMRAPWADLRFVTGLALAYPVGSTVVWAVRDFARTLENRSAGARVSL